MTPQEWIEKSKKPIWADTPFDGEEIAVHKQAFVEEGASHLAAALEEIAKRDAAHKTDSELAISLYLENAELRKAAEWIVECEKWDEGSQLLNEKALAQARIEYRRSSMQIAPTLPMGVEDWMMLVARRQGRDESAAEIARLQAQLSQAERVVPEQSAWATGGRVTQENSHVAWLRYLHAGMESWLELCDSNHEGAFRVYRAPIPASRVLKDGEVGVNVKVLAALVDAAEEFHRSATYGTSRNLTEALDALRAQGKEGAT